MKNSTGTISVTKELKVGVVCPLWVCVWTEGNCFMLLIGEWNDTFQLEAGACENKGWEFESRRGVESSNPDASPD